MLPEPSGDYRCAKLAAFDCNLARSAQEMAVSGNADLAHGDGCMLIEYNRLLLGILVARDVDRQV